MNDTVINGDTTAVQNPQNIPGFEVDTIENLYLTYGTDETTAAFSNEMSESLAEELKALIAQADPAELSAEEKMKLDAMIDQAVADGRQTVSPELEAEIDENYGAAIDETTEEVLSDMSMEALDSTNSKSKGRSWLEALASSLANIQDKFLGKAMENLAKMEGNAEGATGAGGDSQARSDFLQAQSLFQANMQLFNTTMTMSANILKTTGEGLNTMARKGP